MHRTGESLRSKGLFGKGFIHFYELYWDGQGAGWVLTLYYIWLMTLMYTIRQGVKKTLKFFLFLWFGHEPSWSRYLGWSVCFNTNFKTSNLCINDQANNCLTHFSSLIIVMHHTSCIVHHASCNMQHVSCMMHHASCMTQRRRPQKWRWPQKCRPQQFCEKSVEGSRGP